MEEMRVTYLELDNFICEYPSNPRIKKAVIKRDIDTACIKRLFVDSADKAAIKYELTDGSVVKEESIEKHIEFEKVDGSSIRHIIPKWFEPLYMRQYGVNISDDGEFFFLHDWYARGGLSCFEVDTGKLRWCVNIKHAQQAFVEGDHILCDFSDYGIVKILIKTGEIITRYPLKTNSVFIRLNKECFMVAMKQGYYRIVNSLLEEVYRVPKKELNSKRSYSFILESADLEDNKLTIVGSERVPVDNMKPSCLKPQKFKRIIDIRQFAVKEVLD